MRDREKDFLEVTKKTLPDYHINTWDDSNISEIIEDHPTKDFVYRSIKEKKYAFASDVIKLVSSEKFGGWSIDSDNVIYRPLECYRNHSWVSGFENYNNRFAPITAIWGSVPGHEFTKILLNKYLTDPFEYIVSIPNTKWISQILFGFGIINNNTYQVVNEFDLHIYPSTIFCGPWDESVTVSMHHFSGSWLKNN